MCRKLSALPMLVIALFLIPSAVVATEEAVEEPPKLLGVASVEQLREEPFGEWFDSEYDGYEPAPEILQSLKAGDSDDLTLQLFFGTWCGDSRREVPRMLRLFDDAGVSADRIELIAVDRGDGVHKQSPGHEEQGLEIYRVPTLVVRRGDTEVARLVEFPVLSLERDLLAIFNAADYQPNYRTYPIIRRWLVQGLLADANVSARGLAAQIHDQVASEGELAAAAWVMLERGDLAEGLKLMEVNAALHRDSARSHAGVAEARLRTGDPEGAHEAAQRAVRLNEDPESVAELVELLHRSRE